MSSDKLEWRPGNEATDQFSKRLDKGLKVIIIDIIEYKMPLGYKRGFNGLI